MVQGLGSSGQHFGFRVQVFPADDRRKQCQALTIHSPGAGYEPYHPTARSLQPAACTLHPTPFTLHPTPYTLHPITLSPCTLHPTPYHPIPYTLHPTPYTGGLQPVDGRWL